MRSVIVAQSELIGNKHTNSVPSRDLLKFIYNYYIDIVVDISVCAIYALFINMRNVCLVSEAVLSFLTSYMQTV